MFVVDDGDDDDEDDDVERRCRRRDESRGSGDSVCMKKGKKNMCVYAFVCVAEKVAAERQRARRPRGGDVEF